MTLLEDPDIEGVLVDYLGPAMLTQGFTVPVSDRKTAAECLVVYSVGGGLRQDMVIGSSSIVLEAYAARNTRASAILRRAHALLHDLEGRALGGTLVYQVDDFRGPSSDPLPPSDEVRYSSMLAITCRLSEVA